MFKKFTYVMSIMTLCFCQGFAEDQVQDETLPIDQPAIITENVVACEECGKGRGRFEKDENNLCEECDKENNLFATCSCETTDEEIQANSEEIEEATPIACKNC